MLTLPLRQKPPQPRNWRNQSEQLAALQAQMELLREQFEADPAIQHISNIISIIVGDTLIPEIKNRTEAVRLKQSFKLSFIRPNAVPGFNADIALFDLFKIPYEKGFKTLCVDPNLERFVSKLCDAAKAKLADMQKEDSAGENPHINILKQALRGLEGEIQQRER